MTVATIPRLSTIDTLLARLARRMGHEAVPGKQTGTWTADCPIGHVGAIESLDVKVAKDGRIALDCTLGCSGKAIASCLGLGVSDLFPNGQNGAAPVEDEDGLPMAICAIDAPAPEPIAWCVEELLVAREIGLFAGDGGSFKTTGGLHIAAAVAGGYSVFNRFKTVQRPALILSAEDSRDVVFNRLEAIVAGHGWDRTATLSNVHVLASHDAKLSDRSWQAHLLEHASRLDCGFIFLDPLAELIEGDENSNTDVRPIIKFARRLTSVAGAAVVINHHASKVREGQRSIDRVRGASALRDAARCVLFFDSRPEGIAIEHLKMSRAEKLAPFTLTREIESEPHNHATWVTARFSFQTAEEAVLSRAESFVLDQVTLKPGELNSTQLKSSGNAIGLSGEDISKAQTHLQARGLLDFKPAARGAKLWYPTPLSQNCENRGFRDSGKLALQLPDVAHPIGTLPGKVGEQSRSHASQSDPALPFRGGRQGQGSGVPGNLAEDELEVLDSVDIPEEFDR